MVVIVAIAMLIQMPTSCYEASTETAVKNNMHLGVDVGEQWFPETPRRLLGKKACLLLFHESYCPDSAQEQARS